MSDNNEKDTVSNELQNQPIITESEETDRKDVSKPSVVSVSLEPKLSTILEEDSVQSNAGSLERFEILARPKIQHLQETLVRHGERFDSLRVDEIRKQIKQLGGKPQAVQAKLQMDEAVKKGAFKSHEIYDKLQTKLRKVAFDALCEKMLKRLPEMMVYMDDGEETMALDTKCLFDTLHLTLVKRIGEPTDEHEMRMFRYICLGLTRFVERIIASVRNDCNDQQEHRRRYEAFKTRHSQAVELGRKTWMEQYNQ